MLAAITGCTGTHHAVSHPSGQHSSGRSGTGTPPRTTASAVTEFGGVALGQPPCPVSPPATWKSAIAAGVLWKGLWDPETTGAPTPDGSGVFHVTNSSTTTHVAIVGHDQRIVEDIGVIPKTVGSQIGYTATSDSYIAFVQLLSNDESASWRWNLYLWNRRTHVLKLVARNPVDAKGNPLRGGWVRPVVTPRYLYWLRAAPDTSGWGGSALMQYDLSTGSQRVLYEGLTEAFVAYGSMVIFSAIVAHPPPFSTNTGNGPPELLRAVDQATGVEVAPPSGITVAADGAETIVTNDDIIIWNVGSVPGGGLRAWRPTWGRSITIFPNLGWPVGLALQLGAADMPRLTGHFLVFQPSSTYVIDLRTNTFARLAANPGTEEVSGSQLSLQEYTTPNSYTKSPVRLQLDQYLLNMQSLPDLPDRAACSTR
jgi:hypothetical protein